MSETVHQVLLSLPERFDGERAGTLEGVLALRVDGEGGGEFLLEIRDCELSVYKGHHPAPSAIVRLQRSDLDGLLARRISSAELVMEGRMQIRGSFPFAARAYSLIVSSPRR